MKVPVKRQFLTTFSAAFLRGLPKYADLFPVKSECLPEIICLGDQFPLWTPSPSEDRHGLSYCSPATYVVKVEMTPIGQWAQDFPAPLKMSPSYSFPFPQHHSESFWIQAKKKSEFWGLPRLWVTVTSCSGDFYMLMAFQGTELTLVGGNLLEFQTSFHMFF